MLAFLVFFFLPSSLLDLCRYKGISCLLQIVFVFELDEVSSYRPRKLAIISVSSLACKGEWDGFS